MRLRAVLTSVLAAAMLTALSAQPQPSLLDGDRPLVFSIRAPFQQLFAKGADDERYAVDGTFTAEWSDEAIPVRVSVRGNTSKRYTECSFPKLKLKFRNERGPDGVGALKIGTHCGENNGEDLTATFGRLANERAPWREVTVYRLLAALGVPTLRARTARITYTDSSPNGTIVPSPLTRNALIVEDDEEAMTRMGASSQIAPEQFTTAREVFRVEDTARIAFAEALIGNFDWCLAFTADDTYRCDARKKLWNLLSLRGADGAFPVMKDFDLSGPVVGRHTWFDGVYNARFLESGTPIEAEVVAQVQRTRVLFTRDVLDGTRRVFMDKQADAYAVVARSSVDPHGRELAREYLGAFYRAIGTDQAFYRPVVTAPGTRVYADADGAREVCGAGDTLPVGTPVNELRRSGELAQVVLLDVMWHWTSPHACKAVHAQPVWIPASAISANFPAR